MRVSYMRNEDDRVAEIRYMFFEMNLGASARGSRRGAARILFLFGLVLLILSVMPAVVARDPALLLSPLALASYFFIFWFFIAAWTVFRSPADGIVDALVKDKDVASVANVESVIEAMPDGLRSYDAFADTLFFPPAIVGVDERDAHVFIPLWNKGLIAVPIRAFTTDAERAAFVEAVRSLLPDVQGDEQPGA